MFPILYESITTGIIPQHNGLGILSDASSVICDREANTIYELTFEYPISGKHAQDLAYRRVVKAKPNFMDEPQLFRIDRIGKVMNGKFTVYCKHISYDLSGFDIVSGSATSAVGACALLQNAAPGYSITTDKSVSANFKIGIPGSVKSYFVGREGSFLDVFGKTEIKYDNFSVRMLQNAGQNRGVTIRYQKNLLELSQEIGSANLYTHVRCFYKDSDGNVTNSSKISTGLTLDVDRCLIVDVSNEYETTPTVSELNQRATRYKNENNLTVPTNNITLDFVQSGELRNRVDLFDTVNVYYEALGITRAEVKCIRTKYDVIREKYIEVEFGDAKFDVSDTIVNTTKTLADKPSTSFMADAIAHATEMITGNLGGYVILHDSNGDGKPDEILIMNTEDISTSTEVWRWNKSGLGYANSYDGNYETAITQDGQIVANFITAGVLNASVIKAGILSDANGNSTIDMTSGVAKMRNFDARYRMRLLGNSDSVKFQLVHNTGSGTNMTFYLDDGTDVGGFSSSNSNGLAIILNGKNGNQTARLGNTGLSLNNASGNSYAFIAPATYGANLVLRNNSNTTVINNFVGTSNQGLIYLSDSGGTNNIMLNGGTGNITCVSLTQTSSRKTKKNIEDIDDSEKILLLQAVRFDFRDEQKGNDKRGFIAEDVAEILPNLVTEASDDTPASLDYIGMIPYLQDVIKKQQKKIDELESKLNAIIEKIGG